MMYWLSKSGWKELHEVLLFAENPLNVMAAIVKELQAGGDWEQMYSSILDGWAASDFHSHYIPDEWERGEVRG